MIKNLLTIILISITLTSFAQIDPDKIFWQEDFSAGEMPEGWKTVMENDSAVNWIVTDQPFPGSYGRTYQAPPIASGSRGFHLQIAPGVTTGKNSRAWKKANMLVCCRAILNGVMLAIWMCF